jgi:hypothetical protein
MFKIRALAVLVGMLIFTGCPGPTQEAGINVGVLNGNVANPSMTYNLLSAFAAALPCAGAPLVWSIREQNVGWNPALDGNVTQDGAWTSPACGSAWLGQQMHIDAVCSSSNQRATAVVATVPEQVSGVQISFAVVTNVGQPACLAADPTNPSVKPGGTVQFYARVITTCGEVTNPQPPATWPTTCP